MPIQVKDFGWKRDHNDPRDFTPEHKEIHKILTLNDPKKILPRCIKYWSLGKRRLWD